MTVTPRAASVDLARAGELTRDAYSGSASIIKGEFDMKAFVAIGCVLAALAVPDASAARGRSRSAAVTRHCGSFKFGIDGLRPGPSGITARNVSCWFARATALLGAAPGWHCRDTVGLLFVCRRARGSGVVTFLGE